MVVVVVVVMGEIGGNSSGTIALTSSRPILRTSSHREELVAILDAFPVDDDHQQHLKDRHKSMEKEVEGSEGRGANQDLHHHEVMNVERDQVEDKQSLSRDEVTLLADSESPECTPRCSSGHRVPSNAEDEEETQTNGVVIDDQQPLKSEGTSAVIGKSSFQGNCDNSTETTTLTMDVDHHGGGLDTTDVDDVIVANLIARQMHLSRSLAQQEEASFAIIQAMEQRQLQVSKVLVDQEETSSQLIHAVQQMLQQMQQRASQVNHAALEQSRFQSELQTLRHVPKFNSIITNGNKLVDGHSQGNDHPQLIKDSSGTTAASTAADFTDIDDVEDGEQNHDPFHVVIVGAGMAGLTCARTLLEEDDDCFVTILEASSSVGGRIQADTEFCPGYPLDIGAEFIHGTNTLLTKLINEFRSDNLLLPPTECLQYRKERKRQQRRKKEALKKKQNILQKERSRRHIQSALERQQALHGSSDDSIVVFQMDDNRGAGGAPVAAVPSSEEVEEIEKTDVILEDKAEYYDDDEGDDEEELFDARPVDNENFWEEIFISSHADGGPDEAPTSREGMYGMYFFQGKLRMAHSDMLTRPLSVAISKMLEQSLVDGTDDDPKSLHDGLIEQLENLDIDKETVQDLYNLAVAGYGNTATVTDLSQLSLSILAIFERHWEEAEEHGDFRLPKDLGMYSVVQAMQSYLTMNYGYDGGELAAESSSRFQLVLNSPVEKILEEPSDSDENGGKKVSVTYTTQPEGPDEVEVSAMASISTESFVIRADQVVVAVPPPILPRILPDLPQEKRTALKYVGFNNICKIVLKFSQRFWPEKLQSIVSAEGLFPELWFRSDFETFEENDQKHHLVVFYLSDDYADTFVEECLFENLADDACFSWDKSKAAELCLHHLAKVLQFDDDDPDELRHLLVNILIHDWKSHPYVEGGHFAPKVGLTMEHLEALAAPMGCDEQIHFCGEATNTNACGTIQAAMETGVRAARAILAQHKEERKQQRKEKEKMMQVRQQASKTVLEEHQDAAEIDTVSVKNKAEDDLAVPRISSEYGISTTKIGQSGSDDGMVDPENVTGLVQRQMAISRALAKQEETSFTLIQSMEEKQIELSKALLDQEITSLHTIRTLEQMAAKLQQNLSQLSQASEAQAHLQEELQKTRQDREKILKSHEEQIERFDVLQDQSEALKQMLKEKDMLLYDKDAKIGDMYQKLERLNEQAENKTNNVRQEFELKNSLIRDIESIIQVMDQKVLSVQRQIRKAKAETKNANAKVEERDSKIELMAQEIEILKAKLQAAENGHEPTSGGDNGISPSQRMKQVKAAREEKLQQIMRRIRGVKRSGDDHSNRSSRSATSSADDQGQQIQDIKPVTVRRIRVGKKAGDDSSNRSSHSVDSSRDGQGGAAQDTANLEYYGGGHHNAFQRTACIKHAFLRGPVKHNTSHFDKEEAQPHQNKPKQHESNSLRSTRTTDDQAKLRQNNSYRSSRSKGGILKQGKYSTVQHHPSLANNQNSAVAASLAPTSADQIST